MHKSNTKEDMDMTIYGYARVSNNGQDLAAQEAELMAAGCAKVFKEKVSGAKTDRVELAKVMRTKLLAGIVALPLLASAALAGQCQTFCGEFAGFGALGTFARYCSKRKAMQAIPTMPTWTPPFEATGNIAPIIEVEYRRLPN
jgi:hypothetical protein